MTTFIIFILVLFLLIIIHEAGHFLAAKLCKMRVEEFAFGFKPTLFSKKIGETRYSFNLLPIGGYVKISGEDFKDEYEDTTKEKTEEKTEQNKKENIKDKTISLSNREDNNKPLDPKSFTSRPRWQQLIVVLAGVFMNFVLAFVIFFFIAKSDHMEVVTEKNINLVTDKKYIISSVMPHSPAFKNNLKEGDIVLYIKNKKGETVKEGNDFIDFLKNNTDIVYIGVTDIDGNKKEIAISAVYGILQDKNQKAFGLALSHVGNISYGFKDSIASAYHKTVYITSATISGFYHLVHKIVTGKDVSDMVTGPVGIYQLVDNKSSAGSDWLLSFIAVISINLAIFNLLPIPALDGGRAVFITIEMIMRRKLNNKFQIISNSIGFISLLLLMIFVMYKDIVRLFV